MRRPSFDVPAYEKACITLTGLIRHATVDSAATVAITCKSSPPPLTTVLFSPSPLYPLDYVGGIPGDLLHPLFHTIFFRDPYAPNTSLSDISENPILVSARCVVEDAVKRYRTQKLRRHDP